MKSAHQLCGEAAQTHRLRNILLAAGTPIAAGAIVLAATATPSSVEAGKGELSPRLIAAEQVALRYTCQLSAVSDTKSAPEGLYRHDNYKRTAVNLTVNLQDRDAAKAALQKYDKDDSVAWFPPSITGSLQPNNAAHGSFVPILGQDPLEQSKPDSSKLTGNMSVTMYPRADYPEGTVADIFVNQRVLTSDLHDPNSSTISINGYMPCGTMEVKDGAWSLSTQPSVVVNNFELDFGQ